VAGTRSGDWLEVAASTVEAFAAAVNAADLEALVERLAPEHRFIDSLGIEIVGREAVRIAWRRFFDAFPGYSMRIDTVFGDRRQVALFGAALWPAAAAGSTVEAPAAWRAEIAKGKILEWQVYSDSSLLHRVAGGSGRRGAGRFHRHRLWP